MTILPEIIATLSKEEIRNYKLFIKRTNDNDFRKDELLFDLIKKQYNETYNEDAIFKKIYDSANKNPFYRLKNKLQDDIGLSLTFFHFNATEVNIILKDVFLAKLFFDKNAWTISKYYLTKAEKRANDIENYDLLDLIYTEFIKLSHELLDIDPEEYVHRRIKNKVKLDELREVDNILAVVIYKIRSAQTFNQNSPSINQLLEKKIKELSGSRHEKQNHQLKLRLYHSMSRMLLLRQDYTAMESYLLNSFHSFEKEKLFNKNNHDTKLQMLVYLCNTLIKTHKYQLSLQYTEQLKQALSEYGGTLKNKYLYFYYNSLAVNYIHTNREKAIRILNDMLTIKEITTHPMHHHYVYLNLATVYFDDGNYKLSLKTLIKLMKQPAFQHLDEAFKLNIELAELMVRYMLRDFDYLDTKIKLIVKQYKTVLTSDAHEADVAFLKLFRQLITLNGDHKNKKLIVNVQAYMASYEHHIQLQTEVIKRINWLKTVIA